MNKAVIALGVCAWSTVALAVDENYQTQTSDRYVSTNEMNGLSVTAQNFVWDAAITDMKEIHMGELALQKSDNSDVKSFAKDIVSDHKKACKKLKTIAEKEGLNFPSTNSLAVAMNDMNDRWQTNRRAESLHPDKERQNMNTPPHLASLMVSNINDTAEGRDVVRHESMNWDTLAGAQFDRAFVSHMIKGHEKAIGKFETAAASLQDPDLKKYAEKTLPTLREHLETAQELQTKIGTWSDAGLTNSTYQNAYQDR